ncbi:hypothetical protein MJO28_001105 [Puccinia striiformis f. sp. tritici]|uniref:Secreted protein n=3 Tax=Puccinia striiformis TaxID=27350 RepID=A0A0L0VBE2_9BASI|nr:hypothetical protein Pst134EB_033234 [Puccinia striiformis f. sp. tritici]KAI7963011.1 hypothetical protein MJO28_001105 [Puccinia striiformis f. sp. tritici]KAI9607533.1 hypothetical protein KEM48_001543 [Puccinia striiformis f. sp. tritici PST-130]KNE96595.1 hypothetical protein PSTG_10153 [Puccinia striiformis f. sp. tritici PST-78]POW23362.1 hypothetical protein PSHT_00243 [Puccinia striiformis]
MLLVLAIIALVAFPSGLLASSIQVCTQYFTPSSTLNPGFTYCKTADGSNFKCVSNTCGEAKSRYFVNCGRYYPDGNIGRFNKTVYYKFFFADDAGGYVDATDSHDVKFRCGTSHPQNKIRPRCTSCDPRIG